MSLFSRTRWEGDTEMLSKLSKLSGRANAEGYVNVASELGLSGRRGRTILSVSQDITDQCLQITPLTTSSGFIESAARAALRTRKTTMITTNNGESPPSMAPQAMYACWAPSRASGEYRGRGLSLWWRFCMTLTTHFRYPMTLLSHGPCYSSLRVTCLP